MKKLQALFFSMIILLFTVNTASAEIKTLIKEYTYQASDYDSRDSSRTIALETVKRLLLEELGTYLITETEVKNFQFSKDQITSYSAGIVSAEIIDQKWDGKSYWLKAKVSADPQKVEEALKKLVEDKSKLKELEDIKKRADDLTKENSRLRAALEAKVKTPNQDQEKAKNIKAYHETIKGLSAVDCFERGYKAGVEGQLEEAINDFNKAIELNPQYAEAYNNRGISYIKLSNSKSSIHQDVTGQNVNDIESQAIEDFNKAIELKPQYADAYYNRGTSYSKSGSDLLAIKDYYKAIEFNPQYADAYYNLGIFYSRLDNDLQAIKDYDKAIEFNPQYAEAYNNRGMSYNKLNKYQQAIEDFNKAIELKPLYAEAYNNRGTSYDNLGDASQAMFDYNKAIKLDLKYIKIKQGKNNLADESLTNQDYAKPKNNEYNPKGATQDSLLKKGVLQTAPTKDIDSDLHLVPTAEDSYNQGIDFLNQKNYQEAMKYFNKAIEINPQYAKAYVGRGSCYDGLGSHEQAVEEVKTAARLGLKGAQDWLKRHGIGW